MRRIADRPAQPPLPTAWNFPFHPEAGSQTSNLMSESDDGVSVAATRQNPGSFLNACPPPPAAGGVNPPAATVWANVMVVLGSFSDDRLSHEPAAAGASVETQRVTHTVNSVIVTGFMASPPRA